MKRNLAENERLYFGIPVILGLSLVLCYILAPEFYLIWVHSEDWREGQVVESVTFFSALIASMYLGRVLWLAIKGSLDDWDLTSLLLVGMAAGAAFVFAAEESSWGQTFFRWKTPSAYKQFSYETNLHNAGFPLQSLGSLYIILMFFVFPAFCRFSPTRLSRGGHLVSPPGFVVFSMAFGFFWKSIKTFYVGFAGEDSLVEDLLYIQFIEQINEHKEMFIALGLVTYGWWLHQSLCPLFHKQLTLKTHPPG